YAQLPISRVFLELGWKLCAGHELDDHGSRGPGVGVGGAPRHLIVSLVRFDRTARRAGVLDGRFLDVRAARQRRRRETEEEEKQRTTRALEAPDGFASGSRWRVSHDETNEQSMDQLLEMNVTVCNRWHCRLSYSFQPCN